MVVHHGQHRYAHAFNESKVSSLQCALVQMVAWTKQTKTDHLMMLTLSPVGGRDTPTTLPTTPARSDRPPFMPSVPQGASTERATMQPDGRCY